MDEGNGRIVHTTGHCRLITHVHFIEALDKQSGRINILVLVIIQNSYSFRDKGHTESLAVWGDQYSARFIIFGPSDE